MTRLRATYAGRPVNSSWFLTLRRAKLDKQLFSRDKGTCMTTSASDTPRTTFVDLLEPQVLSDVRRRAHSRHFAADEVVFRQGDPPDGVLIVDSGLVKVTVTSPAGSEVLLGLHGPGELLGETSALRAAPRSASVVGHLPGVALHLAARQFRELLTLEPAVVAAVLASAHQRLLRADQHRLALAEESVAVRVGSTLLSWAQSYGTTTDEGVVIGLRATRRELAQVVVASEKTVDDVLTTLRRAELVRTGRRRFVVRDMLGLHRWLRHQRGA